MTPSSAETMGLHIPAGEPGNFVLCPERELLPQSPNQESCFCHEPGCLSPFQAWPGFGCCGQVEEGCSHFTRHRVPDQDCTYLDGERLPSPRPHLIEILLSPLAWTNHLMKSCKIDPGLLNSRIKWVSELNTGWKFEISWPLPVLFPPSYGGKAAWSQSSFLAASLADQAPLASFLSCTFSMGSKQTHHTVHSLDCHHRHVYFRLLQVLIWHVPCHALPLRALALIMGFLERSPAFVGLPDPQSGRREGSMETTETWPLHPFAPGSLLFL